MMPDARYTSNTAVSIHGRVSDVSPARSSRSWAGLPSGQPAIVVFARANAALLERAGPIIMVAVESAGADPAMRRFADQGAAATHDIAAAFTGHLGTIHPLADPKTATATVLAIASPHVHHILRTDAGLDASDYRVWLTDALTATLLDIRPSDTPEG
jgi:hypothetical protein